VRVGRVRIETVIFALIGIGLFAVIPQVTNQFQTFEWANVAVYLIAIVGLNILTGYSGQISLGNGAFMAIGGYTTALMVYWLPRWNSSLDPSVLTYVSIPLGGVIAFVGGLLIGIPALRLRGIYLALATFALSLSITPLANHFYPVTLGHIGIHLPIASPPFNLDLSNDQWLYFFDWIVAAILFVPAALIVRSRTGRAWAAIRDSDAAAVASGINLSTYKTLAFGVSAFYAGVAGSLQAFTLAYTNPDNYGLTLSLALLVGLVIGGLANIWGPLLGAIIIVWLPLFAEQLADVRIGGLAMTRPDVFYGILLILIVFFAPSGLAGLVGRGLRWYRSLRGAGRAEVEEVPVLEAADVATAE
jgi:branched-chain amino acid transport system permease protein